MSVPLRLLAVNVAYGASLAAGWLAYDGEIHAAGKAAVAAVLAVYAAASYHALRSAVTGVPSAVLALSIRVTPMIALVGSVSGFLVAFEGSVEDVQQRVLGASTGLVATLVGVVSMIVLIVQAHLLDARR